METLTKKVVKVAKEDLERTELVVYDIPELPVSIFNASPGLAPYDEAFLFAIRVLKAWQKKGCVQLIKRKAMVYLLTKVEGYPRPQKELEDLVRQGYFREEKGWFIPEHLILCHCYHKNVSIQLV